MYKVIKFFTDLQDHGRAYRVGDTFPRKGLTVSQERLIELSTDQNKRGIPLIEAVEEDAPKTVEQPMPEKPVEAEIEAEEDAPKEIITDKAETPKKGRKSKNKAN